MDVLNDHLVRARASGATFARSAIDPPWGLRLPADTQLAVHAMVQGHGWLWLEDAGSAVELGAGDIALVRGGQIHHLAHDPGAECVDLADRTDLGPESRQLASTRRDVFLCGAYRFAGDVGATLLDSLPRVLHIRPQPGDRLRVAVELLSLELTDERPAQQTVLDRLLDVVLVQAIRHHYDDPATVSPPWYAGENDPALRVSLQAVHDSPEHPWTVPELARLASMSRSTFARKFHEVLGQTPVNYLLEWRMTLARDALRDSSDTLATIARRCGYTTPYAFSSAFSRRHAESPGRWRSRVASEPRAPSTATTATATTATATTATAKTRHLSGESR